MALSKIPMTVAHVCLAAACCSLVSACHKTEASVPPVDIVNVDGSSTVLPLSRAMADAYLSRHPETRISVAASGTGGGFRKFCAGSLDIAGASRPINAAEAAACKAHNVDFVELPVAFDSLTVVANIKNDFVDCLTIGELKTIWGPDAEGRTKQWNQVRPAFPAAPLALFGPGRDSGTFDYFTLAVVGVESSGRNDFTKSEDDTVIEQGVEANPSALGYFGYAYYAAHKEQLKLVRVDGGHGCVLPSPKTVADATYQPLSRPLFLYVNVASAARPEVNAFARFYLAPENSTYTASVGYVPLAAETSRAESERFAKRATGTVMGGHGSVTGLQLNTFDDDDSRTKALLVQ